MNQDYKLKDISMNIDIEDRPNYSNHELFKTIPYVKTENLSKSVVSHGEVTIANPEYQARIIELRLKHKLTTPQIEIEIWGKVFGNGTLAWKTLQFLGINTKMTWNVKSDIVDSFTELVKNNNFVQTKERNTVIKKINNELASNLATPPERSFVSIAFYRYRVFYELFWRMKDFEHQGIVGEKRVIYKKFE